MTDKNFKILGFPEVDGKHIFWCPGTKKKRKLSFIDQSETRRLQHSECKKKKKRLGKTDSGRESIAELSSFSSIYFLILH